MEGTAISKAENNVQVVAAPAKPNVEIIDRKAWTTSRDVAAYFGKRHDAVLRDIRNLLADLPPERKGLHNFVETHYIDAQNGQEYQMYRLDRRGFMLLAMGFNGPKALALKLDYLDAFDAVIRELNRLRKENQQKTYRVELPNLIKPSHLGNVLEKIIEEKVYQATKANSELVKDALIRELSQTLEARICNYVDKMAGKIVERAFGKLISKSFEEEIGHAQPVEPSRVELSPTAFGVLQHIAENREFYSEQHSSAEMLEFGLPYEGTACMLSQWLKLVGFRKEEKGYQLWLPVQWMDTPDFKHVIKNSSAPKIVRAGRIMRTQGNAKS